MISKDIKNIIYLALQSRLLIFIIQVLFNYLIPDHKADAFNPPIEYQDTFLNRCFSFLFSGLNQRWDANHFMHISLNGYTFENQLAFFPLYPLLNHVISKIIFHAFYYFLPSELFTHMAVSTFMNSSMFIASAVFHYQLGILVLRDKKKAFHATQLFCVNPASIFFSASYSESLFCMLSFASFLLLENNRYILTCILISACGLTRSNGLILIGFIVFRFMVLIYSNCSMERISFFRYIIMHFYKLLVGISFSAFPFFLFQYYSYNLLCNSDPIDLSKYTRTLIDYAQEKGYKFIGNKSSIKLPFCKKSSFVLPYSFIQNEFWNVGFFKYYQWKQLPNFLLALPILSICLYLIADYFLKFSKLIIYKRTLKLYTKSDENKDVHTETDYLTECLNLFPYVFHLLFLVLVSIACVHIQVSTRLLCSSSPVIYWLISNYCFKLANVKEANEKNGDITIDAEDDIVPHEQDQISNFNDIDDLIYSEIIGDPYPQNYHPKINNRCQPKVDKYNFLSDAEKIDSVKYNGMSESNIRKRKSAKKSEAINTIYKKESVTKSEDNLHNNCLFKHNQNVINNIEFMESVNSDFMGNITINDNIANIENVYNKSQYLHGDFKSDELNAKRNDLNSTNTEPLAESNEFIDSRKYFLNTAMDINNHENIAIDPNDLLIKDSFTINKDDNFEDLVSENQFGDFVDELDIWGSCFLGKFVNIYFHIYFFVGTAAFSNFLPWT